MTNFGVVRVVGDVVLLDFCAVELNFKLRDCGFTRPSGLRYFGVEILGNFNAVYGSLVRCLYVILCGSAVFVLSLRPPLGNGPGLLCRNTSRP